MIPLRRLIASEMVYGTREAVAEDLLAMGSPIINATIPFDMAIRPLGSPGVEIQRLRRRATLVLMVGWALAYALVAWGLYEATVRTFDRCLGRAPEHARTPRLAPPRGRRWRSRIGEIRGADRKVILASGGPIGDPAGRTT